MGVEKVVIKSTNTFIFLISSILLFVVPAVIIASLGLSTASDSLFGTVTNIHQVVINSESEACS